jgi:hypothetical protein
MIDGPEKEIELDDLVEVLAYVSQALANISIDSTACDHLFYSLNILKIMEQILNRYFLNSNDIL